MIKFFRKIRFRLMETGKTTRYFKYAIGEILLVVIGILIALQINNWNENQKNKQREQLYLKSFKRDLLKNKIELQRVIDKSERIAIGADSLLTEEYHDKFLSKPFQFLGISTGMQGFTLYLSSEGTVKDILGSNTLEIIENDSLRRAIGSWESNLKVMREYEDLGKSSANDYTVYLNARVDVYKLFSANVNRDFNALKSLNILKRQDVEELLGDRQFLNMIASRKLYSEILNELYHAEFLRLQGLLTQLEKELGEE